MNKEVERKTLEILKILDETPKPVGSRIISRKLKERGYELTERSVRYHLRIMDAQGLTECRGRAGHIITEKGIEEVNNALVSYKVGMIINRVDALSYQTTFDYKTGKGDVILNVSLISESRFSQAWDTMGKVFDSDVISLSNMVKVAYSGQNIGKAIIPEGMVGIGTVCAVTINGILLHSRIPVYSKFGGIVQLESFEPLRFTEIISYDGTSLDPAEIFIKSKMTNVIGATTSGNGKILAGFREIPAVCLEPAIQVLKETEKIGFGGIIGISKPSHAVLDFPVSTGAVGLVIEAGLNPIAAVEEAGISTESNSLHTMIDYSKLTSFWDYDVPK
jgi:repressor of nif and glnA expression